VCVSFLLTVLMNSHNISEIHACTFAMFLYMVNRINLHQRGAYSYVLIASAFEDLTFIMCKI
jgi:hypothetical protein